MACRALSLKSHRSVEQEYVHFQMLLAWLIHQYDNWYILKLLGGLPEIKTTGEHRKSLNNHYQWISDQSRGIIPQRSPNTIKRNSFGDGWGKWEMEPIPFRMQRQFSRKSAQIKSLTKLLSSLIDGEKKPSVNEEFSSSSSERADVCSETGFGDRLQLFPPHFEWLLRVFMLSMVWDIPVVTRGHLSSLCPLPAARSALLVGWGAKKGSVQTLLSWN